MKAVSMRENKPVQTFCCLIGYFVWVTLMEIEICFCIVLKPAS